LLRGADVSHLIGSTFCSNIFGFH